MEIVGLIPALIPEYIPLKIKYSRTKIDYILLSDCQFKSIRDIVLPYYKFTLTFWGAAWATSKNSQIHVHTFSSYTSQLCVCALKFRICLHCAWSHPWMCALIRAVCLCNAHAHAGVPCLFRLVTLITVKLSEIIIACAVVDEASSSICQSTRYSRPVDGGGGGGDGVTDTCVRQ